MFTRELRTILALSMALLVSTATGAYAAEQSTDKGNCKTKHELSIRKGLKKLFSGIGNIFKHDESDNDYVDSEPTDQFPIGG